MNTELDDTHNFTFSTELYVSDRESKSSKGLGVKWAYSHAIFVPNTHTHNFEPETIFSVFSPFQAAATFAK